MLISWFLVFPSLTSIFLWTTKFGDSCCIFDWWNMADVDKKKKRTRKNSNRILYCPRPSWLIATSHKQPHSGEIGKLCIESCSSVCILVTTPISALIGQSDSKPNYWLHHHHVNAWTSLGWIDELRFGQCWRWSTSPYFRGTGSDFPCTVLGSTCLTIVSA